LIRGGKIKRLSQKPLKQSLRDHAFLVVEAIPSLEGEIASPAKAGFAMTIPDFWDSLYFLAYFSNT
jgi:hypothetical protein